MNPRSNQPVLRHARQLTLCFAAAAVIASACATVVEEPLEATTNSGADASDTSITSDSAGPLTSTASATGPGNTTTINTSSANTSGGNNNTSGGSSTGGNGSGALGGTQGNNAATTSTTGNTTGGDTTGAPFGGNTTDGDTTGGNNTGGNNTGAPFGGNTTGDNTTGAPFGGNNTTSGTTTGFGATGAGGAGSTGTPVGSTTGAVSTTGSASCEADAWESGKTTTDSNGNAYSEGDLVEYMGVVYSVDQDQNYGHPDCPPDGSGQDWCSTQYSFTPVEDC